MNDINQEEKQDVITGSMTRFVTLDTMKPKTIITILFFTGIAVIMYYSIIFGEYISITNKYSKTIHDPHGYYTGIEVNNGLLGVFAGIIFFIIFLVMWKVFCELILLIFNALNNYINKNNQEYKKNDREI